MDVVARLLENPSQLALLVVFIWIAGDKIFFPLFKLLTAQNAHQSQIVQAHAADATRNDEIATKLISLLTDNLSQLTKNDTQQTAILNEIRTVTQHTNTTVVGLPLTIEQRFNALDTRLSNSQKLHTRTQKLLMRMSKELNLPLANMVNIGKVMANV